MSKNNRSRNKGPRRAYLKMFSASVINTGRTKSSIHAAQSLDGMVDRTRPFNEAADYFATMIEAENDRNLISGEERALPDLTVAQELARGVANKPRREAMKLRDQTKAQKRSQFHKQTVYDGEFKKIFICFRNDGGNQQYFFILVDLLLRIAKRSIIYPSEAAAYRQYERDKVTWRPHIHETVRNSGQKVKSSSG